MIPKACTQMEQKFHQLACFHPMVKFSFLAQEMQGAVADSNACDPCIFSSAHNMSQLIFSISAPPYNMMRALLFSPVVGILSRYFPYTCRRVLVLILLVLLMMSKNDETFGRINPFSACDFPERIRNHDVPPVTSGNVIEVHEIYMPAGATAFCLLGLKPVRDTCNMSWYSLRQKKSLENSAQVTQQR